MVPGGTGTVLTVILFVCAADEPHALFAVTVIFPLFKPAVAAIEVVVEVPDQPPGNVQV